MLNFMQKEIIILWKQLSNCSENPMYINKVNTVNYVTKDMI